MSINSFFQDVLPNISKEAKALVSGDTDDTHLRLQDQLRVRNDMAQEVLNAPSVARGVAAQQAYDAASVLDRQLAVMRTSRADYHVASDLEQTRLQHYYDDLRTHGTFYQQISPIDDDFTKSLDEPYLDADGNIVFDEP